MPAIEALWMRGGTSKGLFLRAADLPLDEAQRLACLARWIGSPDPYGRQTDGLGGATSSTSKVVVLQAATQAGYDIDYWFGQVDVASGRIDAGGSCGNLAAAVGPAALWLGLLPAQRSDLAEVRIWQANLQQKIVARFALQHGLPCEDGSFREDGVPFAGAEVQLDFYAPQSNQPLLPTGRVIDRLSVPGVGELDATMLTAGNPTVFIRARDLSLSGCEDAASVQADATLLAKLEAIRANAAVCMGLASTAQQASREVLATPKIAWVAPPRDMPISSGRTVAEHDLDVCSRILSMGKLHHAYTGTGAVALAVAAQLPGSLVNLSTRPTAGRRTIRIGHASGVLEVQARVAQRSQAWVMECSSLSRSARRLMHGHVFAAPL